MQEQSNVAPAATPAPAPDKTASSPAITPEEATKKWNKKLELEQSLLARIDALRSTIQQIIDKSKTNGSKDSDKKKNSKPKEPVPIPEPGKPKHQVLPLLFGLAFILIKIMNQENLNRQSIYNMNNYFEYITYMIEVYQKLCNSAATKGYPLKTDLLINSLKSFYAYFYMAVSDKMQKLFTSPGYEGTDWISTLSPEEDKKFASMEFMNVIDDLFKDIHPAFEYMVEDYQLTDPATVAKMKGAMKELKEGNSKEGNSAAETGQKGGQPRGDPGATPEDFVRFGKSAAKTATSIGKDIGEGIGAVGDALKTKEGREELGIIATAAGQIAAEHGIDGKYIKKAATSAIKSAQGALSSAQGKALLGAVSQVASSSPQGKALRGAVSQVASSSPAAAGLLEMGQSALAAASGNSEEDSTEETKKSIVFTKSPVPDEGCELGKPCQREINELKSSADEQTDQLNQVLEGGLTTVTMDAITQAVGNLSYDAKDIHISMVKRLEPPADEKAPAASKEAIQKIIIEIRSLVPTVASGIDKWIGAFQKAEAVNAAKPLAKSMITELFRLKDKLIIQKTNGSVLPDVSKLLDEMDTLLKQPMDLLKSMSEGVQKFQELLQKMKVLSGLLEQNHFDAQSQDAIKGADANLMKTIDQIKALMPAMKKKGGIAPTEKKAPSPPSGYQSVEAQKDPPIISASNVPVTEAKSQEDPNKTTSIKPAASPKSNEKTGLLGANSLKETHDPKNNGSNPIVSEKAKETIEKKEKGSESKETVAKVEKKEEGSEEEDLLKFPSKEEKHLLNASEPSPLPTTLKKEVAAPNVQPQPDPLKPKVPNPNLPASHPNGPNPFAGGKRVLRRSRKASKPTAKKTLRRR